MGSTSLGGRGAAGLDFLVEDNPEQVHRRRHVKAARPGWLE